MNAESLRHRFGDLTSEDVPVLVEVGGALCTVVGMREEGGRVILSIERPRNLCTTCRAVERFDSTPFECRICSGADLT